jgi:hypothetical protein
MSDFENRIRDSLRPAATMPVPVVPLDPDRIAARAATGPTGLAPAHRWGAIAAAMLLVAGFGLGAWAWLGGSGGVPAVPAATPQDTVLIDLYSGRENPRVVLDPTVATELYLMLADQEAAGRLRPGDPPEAGLGFRGLVVTPADGSRPALRILPTAVYLNRSGTALRLDDPDQGFYNRVYDAIRPLVDGDVRKALPDSNPAIPDVTATIPPQQGASATWVLATPGDVDSRSTSVTIEVTRLECAGGRTGAIMPPAVSLGTRDIIVRADAEPLPGNAAQSCPGNDSVTVTVALPEPIGDRSLVDAACVQGEAVRTSMCAGGAVRWTP